MADREVEFAAEGRQVGGKVGSARTTANKGRRNVVASDVVDPGSTNEPKQKDLHAFWASKSRSQKV
jgi:hypothetical protein